MGSLFALRRAAFLQKRGLTPRHYWAGAKRIFSVLFYFFSFYI
jgi:hypothetical protein